MARTIKTNHNPTAVKGSKPRTPTSAKVTKITPVWSGKKRARALEFKVAKIDAEGKRIKKRKGRKSVATQMRKQREATRARRSLGGARGKKAVASAKKFKSPAPTKEYNDELKSMGLEWEAEKIVDSKVKGDNRFYLIKWVGYKDSENSWEPEINLRNSQELIAEFDTEFPNKP